jgi:hypothetical protein
MNPSPSEDPFDPVIWRSPAPDPKRPILLAGLSAFAQMAADGELSWRRESRGAVFDWGGVYAEGVRLTGPWTVHLSLGGRARPLGESLVSLVVRRSRVESVHHLGEVDVLQQLVLPPEGRGLARRFELFNRSDRTQVVELTSTLEPFLSPVLVEGIRPSSFRVQEERGALRARAVGSSFRFAADLLPSGVWLDEAPWRGESREGALSKVVHRYSLELPARDHRALAWLLTGGRDRRAELRLDLPLGDGTDPARWAAQAAAEWAAWTSGTPVLSLPDAPEVERGYALARGALRMLYYAPEPGFRALQAGFPWYAAVWGRDLAWMLPAVLWMNDSGWAVDSLRTMFGFQAPERIPILGAEVGEMPMQVSPGPILLYGTSDTTLYYPERLLRVLAHGGGSAEMLRSLEPHLRRVRQWIDAKSVPESGLLLHGGEVEGIREATAGIARVACGIDAPDTTIWDSVDRRDHAIDVQVLGWQAERALARLHELLGQPEEARVAHEHAERLAAALRAGYRWPEERYLFDSLSRSGNPLRHVRPNALLAVSSGLFPEPLAREAFQRATEEDLSTPWGVRTLSSRDPEFRPLAYHSGPVWPIATSWAAQAAFAVGEPERALEYLALMARAYAEEGGLANECYRGDAPEPWNSCCLLGFSVAPFLTNLFEGLFGLRPDLTNGRLSVRPNFPRGWSSARLQNVRLGAGTLHLGWTPEELSLTWTGDVPLLLEHAGGERSIAPNSRVRISQSRT